MILSGMSDRAQLEDNLRTFETDAPLRGQEAAALAAIARSMTEKGLVPCTGCRYCTSHCPQGLDIPSLLALYNEHVFTGGGFLAPMALSALPADKRPDACLGCRSCEAVCPQQIKISEALADFVRRLRP
jgi:predicted aldo/keto reductase-like oxidoreductase